MGSRGKKADPPSTRSKKQMKILSLLIEASRQERQGSGEAGPFSDHAFLISEVRRPPGPQLLERFIEGQRGVMLTNAKLPRCLVNRIHLG